MRSHSETEREREREGEREGERGCIVYFWSSNTWRLAEDQAEVLMRVPSLSLCLSLALCLSFTRPLSLCLSLCQTSSVQWIF